MKCHTSDQKIKNVFSTIGNVDNLSFNYSKDGIKIFAIDEGKSCLFSFVIISSFFDRYECEKPGKISVDSRIISEFIARKKVTDIIEIETLESHLKISLVSTTTKMIRSLKVPLLVEVEEIPEKEIICDKQFTISAKLLKETLKDLKVLTSTATFIMENGVFLVIGNDMSRKNEIYRFQAAEQQSIFKFDFYMKASYLVAKLTNILQMLDVIDEVTIGFDTNHPVGFFIDSDNTLFCKYFVAPLVDEEVIDDENDENEMKTVKKVSQKKNKDEENDENEDIIGKTDTIEEVEEENDEKDTIVEEYERIDKEKLTD